MKKKLKIFLLLILVLSCKSKSSFYNYLEKCINKNYMDNSFIKNENVNVLDSVAEFEEYLFQKKILSEKSKKGYFSLVESEMNKKEVISIIDSVKTRFPFFYYYNSNSMSKFLFFSACPSEFFSSGGKGSENNILTKKSYEKIFKEGTITKETLKEIATTTEYESTTSRLILSNLIYLYWKENYIPKYKKPVRDSIIFKRPGSN